MRHPRFSVALAIALATSLAAGAHAEDSPAQAIDFQSEVSRVLPNDQLHAVLYIERNDKDPAQLARSLATTMNSALGKARGWPAVKVAGGSQSSWPVYGRNNHLDGWRGRAELLLDSRDFKAAADALAALQDTLQLQDIRYEVSEETRSQTEAAMTREAIQAFRARAEIIRNAWGASGYQLERLSLGNAGGQPRPPMAMMMRAAMADAAPITPELSPGETRLTVTANGSIRLRP